nr:nucleotidyl transferase AbiEii/AbiGii toxin family protein [Nannocystis sp.]
MLARVGQEFGDCATLKGGFALELRLARARATNDVDLHLMGSPADVLQRLQAAGRLDLGDYMRYETVIDPEHPHITGAGVQYGGHRFWAECQIAGKLFANRFGIDIAFGGPIFGELETITADDILDFIGVPPPSIRVYPIETHLAEKLHAYTMPRDDLHPNSRVKDLPDLALLATTGPLRADTIRGALSRTFKHRATHGVPRTLPDPPPAWADSYAHIAQQDGLPWPTLATVMDAARRFLDPVLSADDSLAWSPQDWTWSPVPAPP